MVENKDLDMFKLAEEVAKQKNAQDVSLDNIFSDLDNITKNQSYAAPVSETETQRVYKPSLPTKLGDYTTRYEAFKCILDAVNYGTNNSADYVKGHMDALRSCSDDAFKRRKNLSSFEDLLNNGTPRLVDLNFMFCS